MSRIVLAFILLMILGRSPAWADDAQVTDVTPAQVRILARIALDQKDPQTARMLALALLKVDPEDPYAYFVLAQAHGGMRQPKLARKAAKFAYRYADTPAQKYQAAYTAAELSFVAEQPTLAQFWLRRAAQHVQSKEAEAQLARDYARVRSINPFAFRLQLDLRPSDNVNNGADSALQVIDGVPVTGTLSGSAQALSGTIGTVDTLLFYRLRGTPRSRTTLTGRLFVQRVALSASAKAQAPTVSNGDLGFTVAETGVNHGFAIGEDGDSGKVGVVAGKFWYGDAPYYTFGRVNAGRVFRLSKNTSLSLDGSVEWRNGSQSSVSDITLYTLASGVQHVRLNGDQLNFALLVQEVAADFSNFAYTSASFRASYGFAKSMGPAKVTLGVVLGQSDYPDYRVGFIPVPGGRQDTSVYGDVNLFFPDYDFAGFAPTVRFRTGRKSSNVSRFDTRETSVSLGIQSKF